MSVLLAEPTDSPRILTAAGARRLTDQIARHLAVAYDLLLEAYDGKAWTALGYPTWEAYCRTELAEARLVRLPIPTRREVAAELRARGLSCRAIGAGLGISASTVATDLRDAEQPLVVRGTDGKSYSPAPPPLALVTAPTATSERTPTQAELALLDLAAAGARGLTWAELGRSRGWHHGTSSSVLSRLDRRGLVERTAGYRNGSAVYALPSAPQLGGYAAGDLRRPLPSSHTGCPTM